PQEREIVSEQETLFRQLEKIFSIQKSASQGHDLAAIWEVAALPFLRSDLPAPETRIDMLHNLSPYLQACVSDLLKVSLQCINNVVDTDGSLPALRTKITDFLATISVAPGHVYATNLLIKDGDSTHPIQYENLLKQETLTFKVKRFRCLNVYASLAGSPLVFKLRLLVSSKFRKASHSLGFRLWSLFVSRLVTASLYFAFISSSFASC
ncbi:hypothetical protein Tco_1339958, partial [Tanacetum coccineum]